MLGALHRTLVQDIITVAGDIAGAAAGARLSANGIEDLHNVIGAVEITEVREHIIECHRDALLALAVAVGRRFLHWESEFYIDDYIILRVNFPYEIARHAAEQAENPGIGRLSPEVRALAAARRVKDAVYNPRSYHRGHPPAAWAHGPHIDSWAGHSLGGVNLWWAISDVPARAGMVFYPASAIGDAVNGAAPAPVCDPTSLYLAANQQLPPPHYAQLCAGEMLVFDPEMLHGTHLNLSGQTRLAISLRLNARQPQFDPGCFYAREFWHRASDIELSGPRKVIHLAREDHLAPVPAAPRQDAIPAAPRRGIIHAREDGHGFAALPYGFDIAPNLRAVVRLGTRDLLILWHGGLRIAIDAHCPHYGIGLADGGIAGDEIFCPGCAVGFDLSRGCSAAPSLAIKIYPVVQHNGRLEISITD